MLRITLAGLFRRALSSHSSGLMPERIYPNPYMAETGSERPKAIKGGQEMCIGREEDVFQLEVAGPVGGSGIRRRYTREMED